MTDLTEARVRTGIYARVSSDEQRENQTIKSQQEAIDRYLEANRHIEVIDWYVDDGVSGTIPMGERPGGARLLGDARIAAAVQAGMDQRAQRVGMTADDVLRELKVIGMSDVGHYEVGDPVEPVKVRDGAAPEARRAISSVKRRVRRIEREDGPPEVVEDVEFRLWNKPEALRLAGQHLKLFGADGEGGGAVEKVFFLPVVAVNIEEWQRQVAERKALPPAAG